MISDETTNFVWLSEKLKAYQPFFQDFSVILEEHSVPWGLLSSTKDIWARDYMPVQVRKDKYVLFNYDPDYLKPRKHRHLRTDPKRVCQNLPYPIIQSSLVIDGGNIVNSKDIVIMCEKVFEENKHLTKEQVIKQLKDLLEVDKIVFLPWDKRDYTGHADGMVKFINANTVFINKYPKKEAAFGNAIKKIITSSGLDFIELPYNLSSNTHKDGAVGIYMNYLQTQNIVLKPVFGLEVDAEAYKILSQYFPKVVAVPGNDIAHEGGILNCIAWGIEC